jgi:hypothetical protein
LHAVYILVNVVMTAELELAIVRAHMCAFLVENKAVLDDS